MIASTQTNSPLATAQGSGVSPLENACIKLKAAGLRITQPRWAILADLIKRNQPTSIEQLHEELGNEACDLVTVYRCMAAFEEIGLVRRSFYHNGTSLYVINLGEPTRYHVVSKATKQVGELDPEISTELRNTLLAVEEKLRNKGYTDVGHIAEFFGTPPADSGGRLSTAEPGVPSSISS